MIGDAALPVLSAPFDGATGAPGGAEAGGLSPIQAVLRRRWSILGAALLAAGVAAAIAWRLPAEYSATVSVAMDARTVRVINAQSLLSEQMLDQEQLRTEMEPIGGAALAREVVSALHLERDPAFCAEPPPLLPPSLLPRQRATAGSCPIAPELAARRLMHRVSATNDGSSYVIGITARAPTGALAAAIANAYARAFIDRREAAATAVTAQARDWLTTYAGQLREEVAAADGAVAQYQGAHGLTPVNGGTLASQTLSEMNTQLTQLTGEIAQRRGEGTGGAGSALLDSLQGRATDLAAQDAKLRTQYGAAHPDVRAVEAERARLRTQIAAESGRAASRAGASVAALVSRRDELARRVEGLRAQLGAQGEADVRLAALQREAEARRQIYQSVLQRRMELAAQQGAQAPDASIAAEALPPLEPTAPHRLMLVVGAFLGAAVAGGAAAVAASLLSRRFRDIEHIEVETGLPVLGVFPRPPAGIAPQDVPLALPGSRESEAILRILPRLIGLRAQGVGVGQTLVVTSALPGEGKTSFAVALGRAATQFGLRAVVVDCDLRRPAVGRLLALGSDPAGGAARPSGVAHASLAAILGDRPRFVAAADIARVMADLCGRYDLVLLDAPPVLVLADALTLASAGGDVLLVVDWRTTPRRAVTAATQILFRQGARLLGTVTSKTDLRRDADTLSNAFYFESGYFAAGPAEAA